MPSSTRVNARGMDSQPPLEVVRKCFPPDSTRQIKSTGMGGGGNIHKSANGYEGENSTHQGALEHPGALH